MINYILLSLTISLILYTIIKTDEVVYNKKFIASTSLLTDILIIIISIFWPIAIITCFLAIDNIFTKIYNFIIWFISNYWFPLILLFIMFIIPNLKIGELWSEEGAAIDTIKVNYSLWFITTVLIMNAIHNYIKQVIKYN